MVVTQVGFKSLTKTLGFKLINKQNIIIARLSGMCPQWSGVVGPDYHSNKIVTTTNPLTSIKIMKMFSYQKSSFHTCSQ